MDLSGEVHVDHHGIWRKEKKEQTQVNTYQQDDAEVFENLQPLTECPNIENNWENAVTPRVPLDPNKFITGTYIWGPNNQSRGLREIILMAIKTNRKKVQSESLSTYTPKKMLFTFSNQI